MYRIMYRLLVPGWSAKPLVSAHDRIMGTHRVLLVDETSMRKRHRYVTVIVNGDTGKTLAMVQHRNAAALSTFLMQQGHRWCKGVKVVVSDGSKAYKSAIDAMRWAGVLLACVSVLAGSVVSVASAESAPTVVAAALDTSGQPVDVEGAGVHADAVRELHGLGVLAGTECASGGFCWGDPVTREIAAVWIVRVLDGGDDEVDSVGSRFSDVDPGGEWAAHIERLAELGVTLGCAAEPARFCPDHTVTRSQVGSFLARAFELGSAEPAGFGDTAGSVHEANIDALYAAGITTGCSTDPLLFCPRDPTTRAQMASFLNRARTLDTGTDDSDETGSSSSGGGGGWRRWLLSRWLLSRWLLSRWLLSRSLTGLLARPEMSSSLRAMAGWPCNGRHPKTAAMESLSIWCSGSRRRRWDGRAQPRRRFPREGSCAQSMGWPTEFCTRCGSVLSPPWARVPGLRR